MTDEFYDIDTLQEAEPTPTEHAIPLDRIVPEKDYPFLDEFSVPHRIDEETNCLIVTCLCNGMIHNWCETLMADPIEEEEEMFHAE